MAGADTADPVSEDAPRRRPRDVASGAPRSSESPPVERGLRALFLAVLLLGIPGTLAELYLLEHYEGWQLVPWVLMGSALAGVGLRFLLPRAGVVRLLQAVMLLLVVGGILGIWLHYRGNVAFEREMYPSRSGLELFWEAVNGATPALAPGTLVQLGLVGLGYTYRHPLLHGTNREPTTSGRTANRRPPFKKAGPPP